MPDLTPAVTPLDVLLQTMARRWAAGDEDGAIQLAKAAAPYVHPRAQHRANPELSECEDDELDACLGAQRDGGAGAGLAGGDPGEL